MSGGLSRKRARSEDGDDDAAGVRTASTAAAENSAASTVPTADRAKRQRVVKAPLFARQNDISGGAAGVRGPNDIATTPKTPRTVHAMASAITGARAFGIGSVASAGTTKGAGESNGPQGKENVLPFSSPTNGEARSRDALDKLYDVPDHGEDTDLELADAYDEMEAGLPPTPSKKPKTSRTTTPGSSRAKRRTGVNNLYIDGTDKLMGGVQNELSRSARARRTPKKFLDGSAVRSSPAARGRASGTPSATLAAAVAPTFDDRNAEAAESTEASETIEAAAAAAATTEAAHLATADKAKPTVAREAPQPSTPTKAPRRAPASTKKIIAAHHEINVSGEGTPTPRRRGRPRKHPLPGEAPMPKRAVAKGRGRRQKHGLAPEVHGTSDDGGDDNDDDDEVCLICQKPDSEPPNEIIFCESCDLAVHQQCYNVPAIPKGDWFCKNCTRKKQEQGAGVQGSRARKDDTATGDAEAAGEPGTVAGDGGIEEKSTAAAAPTTTPVRDLAPDIANFEHHLARTKRVLLGRCTGRSRVRLQGQEEVYTKAYQVVEQTVVAGEGNSMMIIGARGTGKTTMVETILADLAAKHSEAFHVVRLNGFIHTDDKLALREIWRQLGKEMAVEDDVISKTNNYADTLASLLALLSHPSEIAAASIGDGGGTAGAATPTVTSTSVVFVMDEFDLFATHARQTLLYNLFDIAQARKAPIAVLGLTTKIDVVESLEKRVKSRFSHRYVYLSLPRSLPTFWDICRLGLVVDDKDEDGIATGDDKELGHAQFQQWWKHMIDTAKEDPVFQEQLEFHYYSSKSVPAFWTACIMPLSAVSSAAPRLQLPPVGSGATDGTADVVRTVGRPAYAATAAKAGMGGGTTKRYDDVSALPLAAPDSKLNLLASLSELELSLLIAAGRLDIVLSTDTVNFAMAYDEYVSLMGKQRVQSSLASSGVVSIGSVGGRGSTGVGGLVVGGGARVWGRGVASRAWERLAALGLLIPAGMGGVSRGRPAALVTSGLEGRSMWRTEIALEEIPAAPGVRLGAVLARWCKEI